MVIIISGIKINYHDNRKVITKFFASTMSSITKHGFSFHDRSKLFYSLLEIHLNLIIKLSQIRYKR